MNHRQFSFKNLEPINYLSTFNKMLEYYAKNPPVDFNEKDLKLVALSKFPLPEFYEKMEGIFQNMNKKKEESSDKAKIQEDMNDQQFLKKHNQFMRKILTNIIKDSEEIQAKMQQQKGKNHKLALKRSALSQSKFSKKHETNSHRTVSKVGMISQDKEEQKSKDMKVSKGLSISIPSKHDNPQNQNNIPKSVFPPLKPRKKQQKYYPRSNKDAMNYLTARKTALTARQSTNPLIRNIQVPRTQRNSHKEQTQSFVKDIIKLQYNQYQKQNKFGDQVQGQIKQFQSKLQKQIQTIRSYKFW